MHAHTARCPVCHRRAPVTTSRSMAHHLTARLTDSERPCAGVGLPATSAKLTAQDQRELVKFVDALNRGSCDLDLRAFVLAFCSVSADRLRWAMTEIEPYGLPADGGLSGELAEGVRRFAAELDAPAPELLPELINACTRAMPHATGQVCDILRAARSGS